MRKIWLARVVRFVIFAALGIGIFGFLVAGLWNFLIPELFGGPVINFWQALGLFLLVRIVMFSVRPWGRWRQRSGPRGAWLRKRFEEKISRMTPEEREQFRSQYANRCGGFRYRKPQEEPPVRTEEPANV
jgi:hypothetical protein